MIRLARTVGGKVEHLRSGPHPLAGFALTTEAEDCVAATVIQNAGAALLDRIFSGLKPRNRVSVNLGDGTFIYEGVQTLDSPQSNLWRFQTYGGLCFAEDSRDRNGKHALIFAATGPRALMPRFCASVFGEELQPAAK